jgi:hypothetical protein
MDIKPYIGITGIKTLSESQTLVRAMHEMGFPLSHHLMLGGLASYKGLRQGYVSDPAQYVMPAELNGALIGDRQVMNIVHYNSRYEDVLEQIREVMDIVGLADGIQLNIPWPEPDLLRQLRAETASIVILQVSATASEDVHHDPGLIAARLGEYEGFIDYALIDPSGGTGRAFEPEYAQSVLRSLVASGLDIKWGVAGGLGTGKLSGLEPLLQIYGDLSWDAQARMRTADGQRLDLAACEAYLREGVAMLHKLPGRGSTLSSD